VGKAHGDVSSTVPESVAHGGGPGTQWRGARGPRWHDVDRWRGPGGTTQPWSAWRRPVW
jgi:hypothetical protein